MENLIHSAFDIFFHLDANLNLWAGVLGAWLYALLFLILFCETGLVVTPFLPGTRCCSRSACWLPPTARRSACR